MEGVPDSLKLGSVYSQLKTSRVDCYPTTGNGTYYPTNVISVNLPSRSIIRLGSLSAYFKCTITGLVADATNSSNAQIPYAHKLFSRVQWYVNDIPVNNSNYYDILATALAKCTGSVDWARTRVAQGALDLIQNVDDCDASAQRVLTTQNTGTSKSQYMVLDDILGLPRSNAGHGIIDTGIFGNVRVELVLNTDKCLKVKSNGTGSVAGISYNLSKFRVGVDVISSVSPAYLSMMELRLKDSRPIHFAFQNYQNTIQLNSNSNRVGVSTACLDMVVIAPLLDTWDTRASIASGDLDNFRYSFYTDRVLSDTNTTRLSFKLGSVQYPQAEISDCLDILDLTANSFGHSDLQYKNLLCVGVSGDGANAYHTFSRDNFLSNNSIWAQALSSESEGWASPSRVLSGLNTNQANSEIVVSSQNWVADNGYLFVSCLFTSVLEYDPASGAVRVIN